MIQHLDKVADHFVLKLAPEMLTQLGIDETTQLEVTAADGAVVIRPVGEQSRAARYQAALEATNQQYGNALKRLAQ